MTVQADEVVVEVSKEETFTVVGRRRGIIRVDRLQQGHRDRVERARRLVRQSTGVVLREYGGLSGLRGAAEDQQS
jgi:hypothetical protein